MKKSTVAWVGGAVAAVSLLGAGAVFASAAVFEGGGPPGAGKKAYRFLSMKVDNMLDDVSATPPQRQQINDIKDELFDEGKTLKASMEGTRGELRAQWLAPQVDRTRVHALVDERLDQVRAFAHKAADALIKAHDLFTPDQRQQLSKLHDERMKAAQHW
jgi:Spy/CpxP family protein refolding chaperone